MHMEGRVFLSGSVGHGSHGFSLSGHRVSPTSSALAIGDPVHPLKNRTSRPPKNVLYLLPGLQLTDPSNPLFSVSVSLSQSLDLTLFDLSLSITRLSLSVRREEEERRKVRKKKKRKEE
jgi:hypothetical protein